jgi:type IV pilus assembly protein PilX
VVLIVGLVILLVVTMIGIGSQQSTVLQERMAGNMRQTNIAFQAAESALQAALSYIEQQGTPIAGTDSGDDLVWTSCTVTAAAAAEGAGDNHPCNRLQNKILTDWDLDTDDITEGETYDTVASKLADAGGAEGVDYGMPGVAAAPRIYIEVREEPIDLDAQANSFGKGNIYYYTVTSIGFGETERARAIVQSTIAKSYYQ